MALLTTVGSFMQKGGRLWEAYSNLLNTQAAVMALNSSFEDPFYQYEQQVKLLESSFRDIFVKSNLKVTETMATKEDKEDMEILYGTILNIFEDILLILVSKDLYKLQILKEMILWMSRDDSSQKEDPMAIISRVLNFASKKVVGQTTIDAPCLGVLAAELSLLGFHSNVMVTQQASLGLYHLLCIGKCHTELEFHPNSLYQDKSKIAEAIGQTLAPNLLTDFVWTLLLKLSHSKEAISREAASILLLTLDKYSHKVLMVARIVDTLYNQLFETSSTLLKDAMLQVITLLTRTSPKKIIFKLMDWPVPADKTLIMMWQAAGSEASTAAQVLKTILLILKGKPGELQDSMLEKRRFSIDTSNMMPVTACQALCTLLPVASYKKAVAQLFPELLMAVLLQIYYDSELKLSKDQKPSYAQEALRVLLNCSGLQEVEVSLKKKNCWIQFSEVMYHHHGVYLVAKTLSEYNFPQFPQTLYYLYKTSVEGTRRAEDTVITMTFLTELLNNYFKDPFPEEFLVLYRNWMGDPSPVVCMLSLQKIGSMASFINEVENVHDLLMSTLGTFFSKHKSVSLRGMLTLRRLLSKLDRVTYSSMCIKIAPNYYPLMRHRSTGIRSMAIQHLGDLLLEMSQYNWMLNNVVLDGLVPVVLFLEDTEIEVVRACKFTLRNCAQAMHWTLGDVLEDEHYDYQLVVLTVCNNCLVSKSSYITNMIGETLGFMGSPRDYLKKASIILLGYLAKLGSHLLLKDEMEVMLEAVDRLLWDQNPAVRNLAEQTHSIFQEISHKISSGFKQNIRRLFNVIYVKKLKLLYNVPVEDRPEGREAPTKKISEEEMEGDLIPNLWGSAFFQPLAAPETGALGDAGLSLTSLLPD
ncbi:maestro heat-like repeat-containing protein family member 9 [Sorex fumeus]|uniref:maestro heat-like repeat-containing protein family member 9 n=1 Tax=Sorex fumeus TaxID=62283 RepID=UPI0024ADC37C|nr:maestro heat-like repeat-containing protein family member 9 [Sorex fumeus]